MTPLLVVGIAAGGAAGAALRHLTSVWFAGRGRLPWAVLVVNVVGSLIAGVTLSLPLSTEAHLIIASGVCGGLTTFSTFAVDTVNLVLANRLRAAALNATLNLSVGVSAAFVGVALGAILAETVGGLLG